MKNTEKFKKPEIVQEHKELNPKLWDKNNQLLPEVEDKVWDIVKQFEDWLIEDDIKIKIEDVYLLGSNCNYNYNKDSDLDLHIIVDFKKLDCNKKHLCKIYNFAKTLFNKEYDISFKGIPVEIYIEDKNNLSNKSEGIYSLNQGWIKKPSVLKIPEINEIALSKNINKWESKYLDIEDLNSDNAINLIDNYIDDIYDMRINSIKDEGEWGIGNLTFKEIRRLGYLDNLKSLKANLISKKLSIK